MAEMLSAFLQGEPLSLPAQIPVRVGGDCEPVILKEEVRRLGRKRLLARGTFGGRPVSIKLFARAAGGARHRRRERLVLQRLQAVAVSTPPLLAEFETACGRALGLIHLWVEESAPLAALWPGLEATRKGYWLEQLLAALARLHAVGMRQTDLHLGNFLAQGERLWLLDLGGMCANRSAGPLAPRPSSIDLGRLAAQLPVADRQLLLQRLPGYARARGWAPGGDLHRRVVRACARAWERRLRDRLDKTTRLCSLTHVQSDMHHFLACRRDRWGEPMRAFAADPEASMRSGEVLKSGNAATVVRCHLDGRAVVIKRYNIKHRRHAIGRALRTTRARHSWRAAHLLELAGIPGPAPVFLLERRCGPFRGVSYLVCDALDGPDLLSEGRRRTLTGEELEGVRQLLSGLRACRISHGDFKATNLLLTAAGPALIDLDALRRHRCHWRFRRAHARDLSRLLRNWSERDPVSGQVRELVGVGHS